MSTRQVHVDAEGANQTAAHLVFDPENFGASSKGGYGLLTRDGGIDAHIHIEAFDNDPEHADTQALAREVVERWNIFPVLDAHRNSLQEEYNATTEAICDLARALGFDPEQWDHDSCPNNSDMLIELLAHVRGEQS